MVAFTAQAQGFSEGPRSSWELSLPEQAPSDPLALLHSVFPHGKQPV